MQRINEKALQDFRALYPDATQSLLNGFIKLLKIADQSAGKVRFISLNHCRGLYAQVHGETRIALNNHDMAAGPALFTLAHEVAHSVLDNSQAVI